MESKLDESTGETSTENVLSSSVKGVATTYKRRKCEKGQHSETSNILSMNSSCDSSSENARWKPLSGISDASATDLSSHNSGLMEIPSPKSTYDADHSMKDGKSIPEVIKSKDLEDILHVDPPADVLNSGEKNKYEDKLMKSPVLPDPKDNCVQSHPMDGSDDSDIVEQDVKVCDICGDAGREDLLAICCRCSDGAEHTYCMREMLDKVPEGDWLCEECRYDEEMKNQGLDKIARVDVDEKKCSSSKTSGENLNSCVKSEAKGADEVEKISKKRSDLKILGKRHRDDVEVSSSAKKQAVESVLRSPKKSIASSVGLLSRDNSFRHLESGKEKLTHQSSSRALLISNNIESVRAPSTGPRMQTPRGTFLKSNSFSSSNAKPKVKLVDEVVPPKQPTVREFSPLETKEGLLKSLGKSMSFKNMSSSRLGTGESKVKMLSPKFSHNQDNKGFKSTKERSLFERKNSFKSERSSLNSPRVSSGISTTKSDMKLASRGEIALSSIGNNRQLKSVEPESKSAVFSRSSSLVSRRASDVPVSLGELKRQPSVVNDQKLEAKDDSLISYSAEKPSHDLHKSPIDGSSRVILGGKMRDNGYRSKQNTAIGGRTDISQKHKEVGEVTHGHNDLKAAIEAARLRKPGICRKIRVADQSSDFSQASKHNDVVSQDQSSNSISRKNISAGEVNEENTAVQNSMDSCKQEAIKDVKQITSLHMESSKSRTGDGGSVVANDEKTSIRDLSYHVPAATSSREQEAIKDVKQITSLHMESCKSRTGDGVSVVDNDEKTSIQDLSYHVPEAISAMWKLLPIPEHEFIWQGNFEVRRSVKVELCDGIQAHLSSCASPNVIGAANRFPHKIILNEVPRLSTWPIQFQEYGVREDNIALYFFAKDVDSYEKSYKILLDNMIKHDLALKGITDGVELLIFPSTQLPEKSQRWNMMFFLWGVFRGKKTSYSQQMPGFPKQSVAQQDIPTGIMSLPANISSLGPRENDLSSDAALVAELPVEKDGYDVSGVPSLIRMEDSKQINLEHHDSRLESLGSNSLFSPQSSSTKSCQEIRYNEGGADENCKVETGKVQASVQASRRSEYMPVQQDTRPTACNMLFSQIEAEGVLPNKMNCGTDQANHGKNLGDGSNKQEAHPRRDTMTKYPIVIDDDEDDDVIVLSASKRQNTGSDGSSSSNGGITSQIHGVPSVSTSGSAERFFFPVDLNDKSMPSGMDPSEEDQLHDMTPNLELALGAETEPSTQVIPSFLVNKKVIQDHHIEKVAKEEEDGVSASLSLSLAFPFPEEERHRTSTSKIELPRTERRHVNHSLILFGGRDQ